MLVTAWWFLCPDSFRVEGLRLGVPASVSSLSGVCKSRSHGQHNFRQAWAEVALRRPRSFSRVLIHPPEGTLAYRRGTEDIVSPKVTTPRFPESQGSPSLSSGSVVLVAAGSPDSAAGSPAYRETTCGWT